MVVSAANKENVPPAHASLLPPATPSPLKASTGGGFIFDQASSPFSTPSSKRAISWTAQNKFYTYSETLTTPAPSCSTDNPPSRSILKKNPQIVPMQSLVRETTPEPEDPLNDPLYLASPAMTLAASVHPDSDVSPADLREAYNLLSTRIRVKADPSMLSSTAPAFQSLHENAADIHKAIVRDLGLCLIDPLSSPHLSRSSRENRDHDVFDSPGIAMSSSPVREVKRRGMNDDEIRHARDLYTVCHSALRLLSNWISAPALCDTFEPEQMTDILTRVMEIPLAESIPTPNSRKTYALAIFVLQTQRLPLDILQLAAPQLTFSFLRALEGELGKEGKKGACTDALKAVGEHLLADPSTFIDPFLQLVPPMLRSILSPNASIRSQCTNTIGSLALALLNTRPSDTTSAHPHAESVKHISTLMNAFVDSFALAKEGKEPELLARSLRVTASSDAVENKVTGPIWAACTLASMIILTGPLLFKHGRSVKIILDALAHLTKHKNPLVKNVGRLVWRTLVWAFVRMQEIIDNIEDTTERRKQAQSTVAAWKMVRQIVDGTVGVVVVAGVRRVGGALGPQRALDIVERMLKIGGPKTHQMATEALHQLTSMSTTAPLKLDSTGIFICDALFDGTFMNGDIDKIYQTASAASKAVNAESLITPLNRLELLATWDKLIELWKTAMLQSELQANDTISPVFVDIWCTLITTKVKGTKQLDSVTTRAISNVFSNILNIQRSQDTSSSDDLKFGQRFSMAQQLWVVARDVLSSCAPSDAPSAVSAILTSLAQAVLSVITQLDFDISAEDESVQEPWAALLAGLLAYAQEQRVQSWLTAVDVDVDARRALWLALSRDCNKAASSVRPHATVDMDTEDAKSDFGAGSYDRAIALAGAPFTIWTLTASEWGVWLGVVATAVQRGEVLGLSGDEILDTLIENIGTMVSDMFKLGEIVQRMLQCSASDAPDGHLAVVAPPGVFNTIGRVLEEQYGADPDDIEVCLSLFHELWAWLRTIQPHAILPFIESTGQGLAVWLRDQDDVVSEDQHNEVIMPVYSAVLEALETHGVQLTGDALDTVTFFLVAPALNLEAAAALHKFWTSFVKLAPEARDRCPEILRTRLTGVAELLGVEVESLLNFDTNKDDTDVPMFDADDAAVEESLRTGEGLQSDDSWEVIEDDFDPTSEAARRNRAVSEDLGCDEDNLDWSHQTRENLARFAEAKAACTSPAVKVEEISEAAPSTSVPLAPVSPPPQTPQRRVSQCASSPLGAADFAFCIVSSGGASSSLHESASASFDRQSAKRTRLQSAASAVSPGSSRPVHQPQQLLGKRRRASFSEPVFDTTVVIRRPDFSLSVDDQEDSIVDDSILMDNSQAQPRTTRRRVEAAEKMADLPISEAFSSTSAVLDLRSHSRPRKRRILDAVESAILPDSTNKQHAQRRTRSVTVRARDASSR
ncbi:hypothetical protein BKA62DRAFT_684891 [Auriculariales sp. MPI-PUGE-AT-0066]|nr:hypothetical protein BKA62DRAFT_684891 [Auriculariales sp. MPI-PUGE-AT-0066]